jgi:hypothetical protein
MDGAGPRHEAVAGSGSNLGGHREGVSSFLITPLRFFGEIMACPLGVAGAAV